jgi:hypothetical protein
VTKTDVTTDVGIARRVEADTLTGDLFNKINVANRNLNLIDLVASRNSVYKPSPGNSTTKAAVVVMNISGGRGIKLIPLFPC